jgi:hypothetical protein
VKRGKRRNGIKVNAYMVNVGYLVYIILPLCLVKIIGSNETLVEWQKFAMETTMSKSRKTLRKLTLVDKKM